jgi:hypothetical protein
MRSNQAEDEADLLVNITQILEILVDVKTVDRSCEFRFNE